MYRSEKKVFGCSFLVSIGTHAGLIVLILLLSLLPKYEPPPPPEEKPIEVEFTTDATGQETPAKAEQDSPKPDAPSPEKLDAPPSPTPPKQAPLEETPPPPPPPPPMPPPPEAVSKINTPQPVTEQAMETPAESAVTLPPSVAPLASSSSSQSPAPPSPSPIPNALPTTQTFSHLTKTEKSKNEVADSHSLEATLDAYRADQKQTHPPKSAANPRQGGSPNGGGARSGDITRALSAGQQGKIAASVRRCYVEDTAAKDYATFSARLIVTVDSNGDARMVEFEPATKAKMASDSSYRALAERARDAVLSPTCSKLPIPSNLLGKTAKLRFVFRP